MTLWKRSWDTAKWTELDCQAARETVEAYEHAHEVGARGASTEANKQIDRLKQAIINYESEQKLALAKQRSRDVAQQAIAGLEQMLRKAKS